MFGSGRIVDDAPFSERDVERFGIGGRSGLSAEKEVIDRVAVRAIEAGAPRRVVMPAGEIKHGAWGKSSRIKHGKVAQNEIATNSGRELAAKCAPSCVGIAIEDTRIAVVVEQASGCKCCAVKAEGLIWGRSGVGHAEGAHDTAFRFWREADS